MTNATCKHNNRAPSIHSFNWSTGGKHILVRSRQEIRVGKCDWTLYNRGKSYTKWLAIAVPSSPAVTLVISCLFTSMYAVMCFILCDDDSRIQRNTRVKTIEIQELVVVTMLLLYNSNDATLRCFLLPALVLWLYPGCIFNCCYCSRFYIVQIDRPDNI